MIKRSPKSTASWIKHPEVSHGWRSIIVNNKIKGLCLVFSFCSDFLQGSMYHGYDLA